MSEPVPPTRSRPSRGVWFALFWISCLLLSLALIFAWPDSWLVTATSKFFGGMMSGSLVAFFSYWLAEDEERQYIEPRQFFWIIPLLAAALFSFEVALSPHSPWGDHAGRALGWSSGSLIGYTLLFAGRLKKPPPEVLAQSERGFRWGIVVLVALTIASTLVAWYRLGMP